MRFTLLTLLTAALAGAVTPALGQEETLVPVAARDLPRGITLAAEDIEYRAASGVSGRISADIAPGWVTRRVIGQGEPLREPAVARPVLVRAGEPVEVIWREANLELRLRGTALGPAGEGEKVTVRIDTRRRLDGVAVAPGLVQINGGRRED